MFDFTGRLGGLAFLERLRCVKFIVVFILLSNWSSDRGRKYLNKEKDNNNKKEDITVLLLCLY